ncbi:hypothetical protein J6590_098074, partial [Homalodisca vitripennis]
LRLREKRISLAPSLTLSYVGAAAMRRVDMKHGQQPPTPPTIPPPPPHSTLYASTHPPRPY